MILVGSVPAYAHAAPEIGAATPAATQSVAVEVAQPTPSITPDGTLRLDVTVTTAAPAEYLEVRVRLRSPSGKLVYQKTEIRSGLPAGSHDIAYEHDMATVGLQQGRYPIDVRVLVTDADPTTVTSRLLVVGTDAEAIPVALVVVPTGVPYVTMDGTFAGDPASDTRLRDDLAFLTQLASDGRKRISLAVPPVLIEQLARVAAGYETTAGVAVPASDETPIRYARMLDSLRSAVDTGTIELIDVPYGLPDLADLDSISGSADIDLHWRQTDTVHALAFATSPESSIAYLGDHLTVEGLSSAARRGAVCVLAPEGSIRSGETTASPGCYTISGTDAKVLVTDGAAAAGAHEGPEAFYDALFDRLGDGPAVVVLEVGPDSPHTTLDVRHAIEWIDDAPWLRESAIVPLTRSADAQRAVIVADDEPADPEYWADVVAGRSAALAYSHAAGPDDADAAAAIRAVLAAESSIMTTGDPTGPARAQGLDRAAEALAYVTSQFELIRLDAKDVTLSGSKGDVPLTLMNDTGKQLDFSLLVTSGTRLSTIGSQEIVAQPTQNFITLPVDLGNALSDEITLAVQAGGLTVAEAKVSVRASYIDRLATVLMVVLVLAVLLVIIRRKVGDPVAGTILKDSHGTQRASREK